MRTCKNCGAPLDSDALFCTSCGTKNELEEQQPGRHCPHCGAPMDDDALFCTSCGQRVENVAQPIQQDQPALMQDTHTTQGMQTDVQNDVEVDTSGIRPWHYALGIGVVVIALAAIIVPRLLNKTERVPLLTTMPQTWYRFVKSKGGDLPLYNEPNIRSQAGSVGNGEILPILEETETFYKTCIGGEEYFVRKKHCEQFVNTDIDHDVMMELLGAGEGNTSIVTEGAWKGLYVHYGVTVDGGEYISMGILHNGRIIQPITERIETQAMDGRGFEIVYSGDGTPILVQFGKNYYDKRGEHSHPWLDVSKLSDEQIVELWHAMQNGQPDIAMVGYYFEKLNHCQRFIVDLGIYGEAVEKVSGQTLEQSSVVTEYSIQNSGDNDFKLLAKMGDEMVETGLDYSGNMFVEVVETGDFDGDGSQDCLVCWNTGGNGDDCVGTDLVYFSEDEGKFCQMEGITAVSVEQWQGKTTLVSRHGIGLTRYVLEKGKLKEVESKTADVGKAVWTRTRENMFPVADELSENRDEWFDLDGDGEDDKITFGHNNSHACDWGRCMYIDRIECTGGTTLGDEYFGLISGERFQMLDRSTSGMHDLLIDNILYRWNGSAYDRWEYDGNQLYKVAY